MFQKSLNLKKLVNIEDWQKIQDTFSEVIGTTLRTLDLYGKPLTRTSGSTRLCDKIRYDKEEMTAFRDSCPVKKNKETKIDYREITNLVCPFALDAFIVPIKAFGNKTIAYIVIGPVILNKRKDRTEYEEYAKKVGIAVEDILDDLIEINVFSNNKIRSAITLISDMFSYMAKTGYHKKRLGEIGKEVVEVDPLFSAYYEEKILGALLNTCTVALDADSGSVMTVDKRTNHLHIKVSSRLDKNIADRTDIKVGEGIAGIAAATSEPIILPKDRGRNDLSGRMKRDYIKSSMIMPFNKADTPAEVYGVINLNMVRKDREFSEKDVALVKELVSFASIALSPVK